jgi:hypothetical protein
MQKVLSPVFQFMFTSRKTERAIQFGLIILSFAYAIVVWNQTNKQVNSTEGIQTERTASSALATLHFSK